MSDIFIGMNIDIRDITYSYTIYRLYIFMYIDFLPILWKYYRYTRWWFQIFLIFIPILGKDSHFWLIFFSKGLVQPPTSIPSRELTYPPKTAYLKMIFLFPNWDTLVPLEGNVTCNCAFPSLKKPSSHSHQTLESTMISFNGVISAATRGRQWQVPMCWEKTGSGEGEKQIQNQNGDIYIWLYICICLYIYSMEDLTFVISNSCEDWCLGSVSSKFFTGSIKILPRFLPKQTHVWSGNFTIFHPRTVMKLSAWLPPKRWNCFGDSARARQ